MNFISNNSKKFSFLIFTGIGSLTFYNYHNIARDLFNPRIHPTKEYAEMLIKLDKRITNFCGYNYTISGFKVIENTEKYESYRMNLNGIRGICKVLVKVQKLDQEELNFINEQQKKIARMPSDQRKKEPFVPIDFKDILIPTENTKEEISERLKEISEKYLNENKNTNNTEKLNELKVSEENTNISLTENDFKINILSLDSTEEKNNKNIKNKINQNNKNNQNVITNNEKNIKPFNFQFQILNKIKNLNNQTNSQKEAILNDFNSALEIKDKDSFYRFMNISVSFSDDVIFNIRPLSIKFRNYDLIDTEYSDRNYFDIYRKINKIKGDFYRKKNYEISAEEAKEEVKVSRQNYFNEKIGMRQNFIKYQVIIIVFFMLGYRHYMNTVNYQNIYKGVVKNLMKNKILKKKLGENISIPYISYSYNLFNKNFTFQCLAQNGNKKIIVKGKSLPNADNILPTLNFYDKENKMIKV